MVSQVNRVFKQAELYDLITILDVNFNLNIEGEIFCLSFLSKDVKQRSANNGVLLEIAYWIQCHDNGHKHEM